jgi:hypothetical protein
MDKYTKAVLAVVVAILLPGCETLSMADRSNFSVCDMYNDSTTMPTGNRIILGIMTLGSNEIGESIIKPMQREDALEEMQKRNITDCSPEGQAHFECSKLYSDTTSADYKTCFLATSKAVEARTSSRHKESSKAGAAGGATAGVLAR